MRESCGYVRRHGGAGVTEASRSRPSSFAARIRDINTSNGSDNAGARDEAALEDAARHAGTRRRRGIKTLDPSNLTAWYGAAGICTSAGLGDDDKKDELVGSVKS